MPDTRPPASGEADADEHDEVLGRVDSLMARLRPATAAGAFPSPGRPVAPTPPPMEDASPAAPVPSIAVTRPAAKGGAIPLLTDVVSLGPVTARAAPPPQAPTADIDLPDVEALEQAVYRRLGDRLDHEVATLLERRVMPELAGSLDQALALVATEIKGSIRQLVRETIEETLQQHVRNLRLPLGDGTPDDTDPAGH